VRVRIGAKRWQKMVLARPCQLKGKSPLQAIDLVDPFHRDFSGQLMHARGTDLEFG
jgi:hypothetical protein